MTWLLMIVGAWVLWVGLLFALQRRLVFPRHLLNPVTAQASLPPGVERWSLETSAGAIPAWYVEPAGGDGRSAPGPAVIFAHGNAELARDWAGAWRDLAADGVAVLLVEYPGYGEAPGEPARESIAETMVAAWDSLAARPEVDPDRIVGLGRSLGGGAVTDLARRRPLAALVLQSTFTRVRDFSRRFLVPGVLVRDDFDNLEVVESFDGPVLVLHGRDDEVIPFQHGRRLAEAAREGELVEWSCGHNDCPPDWPAFVERISRMAHSAVPRRDSGR